MDIDPSGQLPCTRCVCILGFAEQKQSTKMLQRFRPTKLTNKTWPKSWTGMKYRDVEILYNLGDGIMGLFIVIYLLLSLLYAYTTCAKGRKWNRMEMRNYLQTQSRQVEVGDAAKISQFLIHNTLGLGLIAQNSVILTAPRFESELRLLSVEFLHMFFPCLCEFPPVRRPRLQKTIKWDVQCDGLPTSHTDTQYSQDGQNYI